MVLRRGDDGKLEASLSPSAWIAVLSLVVAAAGGYRVMQVTLERFSAQLDRIELKQAELAERVSRIEGSVNSE